MFCMLLVEYWLVHFVFSLISILVFKVGMAENTISFFVNGKSYSVDNVGPTDVLNSWLRSQPGLTGTKSMCYEGGCGSCVVALQRPAEPVIAVNSVSFKQQSCTQIFLLI